MSNNRISRSKYILIFLSIVALNIFSIVMFGFGHAFAIVGVITFCYGIYRQIMTTIKRLHDFNQSGWYSLLLVVPLVNLGLLLVCLFTKSDEGVNKFGDQVK